MKNSTAPKTTGFERKSRGPRSKTGKACLSESRFARRLFVVGVALLVALPRSVAADETAPAKKRATAQNLVQGGEDLSSGEGVPENLPPLIEKIIIDCDGSYSEARLQDAMAIQPGQRLWPRDVAITLRNLWLIGDFEPDIRIYTDGLPERANVIVYLERRPYMSKIRIHGGYRRWPFPLPWPLILFPSFPTLSKTLAYRSLTIREGRPFDGAQVDLSAANLRQLLERDGFFEATVKPRILQRGKSVQIDFDIKHGPPAILREITIRPPDDSEAAAEIQASLKSLVGRRFSRKRLNHKLDRIRKRLALRGYFELELSVEQVHYKAKKHSAKVTIRRQLGPRMLLQIKRTNPQTPLPANWNFAKLPFYREFWSRIVGNVYEDLLPIWDHRSIELPILQQGERNLKRYYHSLGYPKAKIRATRVIRGRKQQAIVEYRIDAGQHYSVAALKIEGNTALRTKTLRKALNTRPAGLFRKGNLDPDALRQDILRIQALYRRQGFHATEVQITRVYHAKEVDVTFLVSEGIQTHVAGITIQGNHAIPTSELLERLPFQAGQPFEPEKVIDGQYLLYSFYNDRGYSSTVVEIASPKPLLRTPEMEPWPAEVQVVYRIYESELFVFGPTIIRGLNRSHRWTVQKEITYRPGDPFDLKKLFESASRVRNLGLFDVQYFNRIEDDYGLKTILAELEELPAGTVGFGVGFTGRSEGTLFRLPLNKISGDFIYRNIGGYGAQIGFAADISFDRQEYRFQLGHPHLSRDDLTLNLSMSLDNQRKDVTYEGEKSSYSAQDIGGTLVMSRRLNRTSRLSAAYRFSLTRLYDLDLGDRIQEEDIGSQRISSITPSFSVDSRNFPFNPTAGIVGEISLEIARKEIGSENNFIKLSTQARFYRQLRKNHVLATSIRYSLGANLPFNERSTLGGYGTLRGIRDQFGSSLGSLPPLPDGTLPEKEIVVGGNALALYNLEYRFPLFFGLGGQVWGDFGNVFDEVGDFRPWALKTGLGAGLRFDTPIGPLRFDAGAAFDEDLGYLSWDYYVVIGHPF